MPSSLVCDLGSSLLLGFPVRFWGEQGKPDLDTSLASIHGEIRYGKVVAPCQVVGPKQYCCLQVDSPQTPGHPFPLSCFTHCVNSHPSLLFPKILTKHFCTIKFNHNYKNVVLGFTINIIYNPAQQEGPAPHHPGPLSQSPETPGWEGDPQGLAGTDEAGFQAQSSQD